MTLKTTASEWALQRAAQAWCDERTSNRTMDEQLACVFAEFLDAEHSPLAVLRKALQSNDDYAWAWQCNLAMAFYDELIPVMERTGIPEKHDLRIEAIFICNRAATRFMKSVFNVTPREPGSEGR